MMQWFEYGERFEMRKREFIETAVIAALSILAVGAGYGVLMGYGLLFSLFLPSIWALGVAGSLVTNVHHTHFMAPVAILTFFIFSFFLELGFVVVLGWIMCVMLAGFVGVFIYGVTRII